MNLSPSKQTAQLSTVLDSQQAEPAQKPTLLPAFEPLSSSPFPRPQSSKRKYAEDSPSHPKQELKFYPTPVPTSSTGLLQSSSPTREGRPGLQRAISTLSQRTPLGALPSVELPADGEPVRMGRSSNSSDYQLSTEKTVSRVHVVAAYRAPTASYPNGYVHIECLGWNGATVHCEGNRQELEKGQSFISSKPEAEIMLDVQDARVLVAWPFIVRKLSYDSEHGSDTTWEAEVSPSRRSVHDHFASSPPVVPRSPVSQSPIRQPNFTATGTFIIPNDELVSQGHVKIFEDADADEHPAPGTDSPSRPRSASPHEEVKASQSSILSSFASDDVSDDAENEENDPIVHSFGPFGANLLPRMASFTTSTPKQSVQRRRPLTQSRSPQSRSGSESTRRINESPIKNHVINQLAFSRVHSVPLSTIYGNLPGDLKVAAAAAESTEDKEAEKSPTRKNPLSSRELKSILDGIPCVGEINREGKDAAGKQLENEFYYVPEMDADTMRREAVTGSFRGTGLRAVRKSHKQYYWKRPKY